jgi:hypothetical protein
MIGVTENRTRLFGAGHGVEALVAPSEDEQVRMNVRLNPNTPAWAIHRRTRMAGRSRNNWVVEGGKTLTSEIPWLLYELCVEMGFCLSAHVREELISAPPEDVDAFTDAVLLPKGLMRTSTSSYG